ncbi:MAG: transposase [Thermodesulfobacteriota bacterium]
MPRANRHYIPGYVWHITHRCHKKEFLLKFARDRRRYLQWLFEAKKRYGLSVLNYMVTSNHIHLLVRDIGGRDTIPNSIQLIAGRTGQEFNQRKKRKGAYWEDRYHATAVETGRHLIQCLLYMELNMVRAGVVKHPSEWPFSGYNEIRQPRQRYALIDYEGLKELLNFREMADLADAYRGWVTDALGEDGQLRDGKWSESVAVGSELFVRMTKEKLGFKAKGREVIGENESYVLRESPAPYNSILEHQNDRLSFGNTYFWDDNV